MSSTDFEAVDDALESDPSVEAVIDAAEFGDEKYYQFDWSDEVEDRIDAYIDHEGSMLTAEATADGWQVRLRFVSRGQFDTFRETLRERDESFDLLEFTQPDDPRRSVGDLTRPQREALRAANEHGYYSVPRELAAELDMSHQNLSELLRRATEKLIDRTLQTSANTDEQ